MRPVWTSAYPCPFLALYCSPETAERKDHQLMVDWACLDGAYRGLRWSVPSGHLTGGSNKASNRRILVCLLATLLGALVCSIVGVAPHCSSGASCGQDPAPPRFQRLRH
mmetsp:Transcript_6299/g.9749  ORF Transcript_6299/g.9749 Transcript_6299/m.9749 type:complete len:109 (+) Transcript_6299:1058-1384(+)